MSVVNGFLLGTLADDDILSFNVYAWDQVMAPSATATWCKVQELGLP